MRVTIHADDGARSLKEAKARGVEWRPIAILAFGLFVSTSQSFKRFLARIDSRA